MSLEKRIKRHILGRRHDFWATTLPGHEQLCADELESQSGTHHVTEVSHGGICFSGRLTDLYMASLHLRTAGRILLRLVRFKATNFDQLANHTRNIAWELFLPPGCLPKYRITAHHSRLYHTSAVAEHIERSIAAKWTEHGVNPIRSTNQTLYVRLLNDRVSISLDSSGKPLYQRGLKIHTAHAPLRETTAAAILMKAGYQPDMGLIDPMCGSGTFSLEAALIAKNIAPGLFRDFAFIHWPAFRPRQWAYIKKNAEKQVKRRDTPLIWASDVQQKTCTRLFECVQRNNLGDAVSVANQNFFDIVPRKLTRRPGLVVLNPPYGRRLGEITDGRQRYKDIAAKLKTDFKEWRVALLVPEFGSALKLGLSLKPLIMQHGGLKLTLLVGRI